MGRTGKKESGKAVCEEGRLEFIWFLIIMERAVVTRPVRLRLHPQSTNPRADIGYSGMQFQSTYGNAKLPSSGQRYFF